MWHQISMSRPYLSLEFRTQLCKYLPDISPYMSNSYTQHYLPSPESYYLNDIHFHSNASVTNLHLSQTFDHQLRSVIGTSKRYDQSDHFSPVLTSVHISIISCPHYCTSFLIGLPAFTLASLYPLNLQ